MKITLFFISTLCLSSFWVFTSPVFGLETYKEFSAEHYENPASTNLKIEEPLYLVELTISKFNQIKFGMSYREVVDILGEEGVETQSSKIGIKVSKTYVWKGEDFKRISATFTDNQLKFLTQSGLTENEGDADITTAKFDQIQNGMSYQEIKTIIGSDGEKTSMSLIGETILFSYVWRGKNFKTIRVSLKNDKLTYKTQKGLSEDVFTKGLSIEKFNKFKFGMSYDEVVEILGSEGEETRSSVIEKEESKTYVWKGEKFQRISATFRNGELKLLSQSGLTGNIGKDDITKAKFEKIRIGMSYEQVKGIIGSDGEKTSMSEIGNSTITSYVWKAAKFQTLRVIFKDDKVTNKTQTELK